MSTVTLKPELFHQLLTTAFQHNYVKKSDDKVVGKPLSSATKKRYPIIYIDSLITFAMSSRDAMSSFVDFQSELTFRMHKDKTYLHDNNENSIDTKATGLIDVFYRFVQNLSINRLAGSGIAKQVKAFMNTMNKFNNLRHMDLSEFNFVYDVALRKMEPIFANLSSFYVDADTLIKLKRRRICFPKLERMKLTGYLEDIQNVTTTAEDFPLLAKLEIKPWFAACYNDNPLKDLIFAYDPFPTVKNVCIHFELKEVEKGDLIEPYDIPRIQTWLKNFSALTKAEVTIKRSYDPYPHKGPECYTELHNLIKSTDFGVPLKVNFLIDGRFEWPDPRGDDDDTLFKQLFSGFERIYDSVTCATYFHHEEVHGKTIEHTITLEFEH